MKQRTRLGAALAGAALLVGLVPGRAGANEVMTATPLTGAPGTVITISGKVPCPAPPTGVTFEGAAAVLSDGSRTAGESELTSTPERNWSGTLTVAANARNGYHRVVTACVYSDGGVYLFSGDRFVVTSPSGTPDPVLRLAGNDRIATAIATSQDLRTTDGVTGAVVLSRSDSYADALAGTPLAAVLGAPLLLTGQASLDPRTEAEIKRLLGEEGEVHLLGGTAALSPAVASRIQALGYDVVRYAGTNRYDTAVKVASIGVEDPTAVLLATGTDFRAGLIAGVAAPFADMNTLGGFGVVLLTNGATMPPETAAYLETLGNVPRYAVGAPAAAAAPTATKLVGADDAATSVQVAERFFSTAAEAALAGSATFPDALSGGAHATANGAPLLLTGAGSLAPSVQGFLAARKASITIGYVYGGSAAVAESTRTAAAAAIN